MPRNLFANINGRQKITVLSSFLSLVLLGVLAYFFLPRSSADTLLYSPKISSFSPKNASSGSLVVLTGLNFGREKGKVYLDEQLILDDHVVLWNDRYINLFLPANPISAKLKVLSANNLSGISDALLEISKSSPIISSFSPSSASTGENVVVSGSNFGPSSSFGAAFCTIDNKLCEPAQISKWENEKITLKVPALPKGKIFMIVVNANGVKCSSLYLSSQFTAL